ncbi:hypothetical protein BA726_07425 [Klebsiella pneumoniae]|nr:hypothetical protein H253_1041 [Klebsiella pneumoniae KP-7]EOZ71184.1 hypothetical protein H254_0776 [Klebsiella pneumoniae KP-11]OBX17266.1 hypothetical protein BA726_07425 [Klebsiella pneumoniae]VGA47474.1 D- and L-methionine ABC transporter ATP-binding protein [Klebsiella pneumoniae]
MIAIDDLHKSYRTADGRLSAVLKGLSLQVPERSITAVVGPSAAPVNQPWRAASACWSNRTAAAFVSMARICRRCPARRCAGNGGRLAPFSNLRRC